MCRNDEVKMRLELRAARAQNNRREKVGWEEEWKRTRTHEDTKRMGERKA